MFKDEYKYRYTTIPFAIYRKASLERESAFVAHNHRELEVIAMTAGTVEFYVDSVMHELHEGDVLVIPPYCIHRAHILPRATYECVCFDLSILWDEELARGLERGSLTVGDHLIAGSPECTAVWGAICASVSAFEARQNGWEMEVIGHLSLAFARLRGAGYFITSTTDVREHAFCKDVLDYVDAHYHEPITSATAASSLYLNNSYFCRLFKRHFGCSFSEFVNSYRIEKAKFRLSDPQASISEIAISTGFNSFSYFCKMFKRSTGVSPTEYRRGLLAD